MPLTSPEAMSAFSPVTDADLDRARSDPAFRQKLLSQSLEDLLAALQRLRSPTRSTPASPTLIREGVQLAVRLAEIIQNVDGPAHRS